jgi:hypothetical protein
LEEVVGVATVLEAFSGRRKNSEMKGQKQLSTVNTTD